MTDNLKPCPFCGSSMVDINVDGGYRWCECGNNDCRASAKAFWFIRDAGNADHIVANNWNTRPIEDALRAQLAEAQAEVERLNRHLEEAGKALAGLGYTASADDSGSYDSLIPDEYKTKSESWIDQAALTIKYIKENREREDRMNP